MRLASAFALFASAFAVFPALAGPASAGPAAAPPLWSKALALAAAQESLVPGKIVMHQELRSRSGELEHFGDTTLQVVPGKDGDVRAEVAAASEDGKDVTAEARRRQQEEEAKAAKRAKKTPEDGEASVDLGDTPFAPKMRSKTTVRETAERRTVDGRACVVHEISWPAKDGGRNKGRICLDEETGAPRDLVFSPDPLPKHVSAGKTSVRYRDDAPDGWRPRDMTIDGEGGILFIKKKFHMVMTFSDYLRRPAKP